MSKRFQNRTALVTGAGSGIGRSSALAFAQEGANVIVSDIDVQGGEETVQMIQESNGDAHFFQCDVSQSAQVEALIKVTIETFGRLDFAVNNAGVSMRPASTVEIDEAEWDRVISINLKSVWLCMKHEIPQMQKTGGGVVINMSSLAGIRGKAGTLAYSASKHGVIGMTKTAALEFAKEGIRINAICPGLTESGMTAGLDQRPELAEQLIALIPMGRMGLSENIADGVVWLCDDKASFITGHVLVIDGGQTIP
jgi:NAD(P)-dependent dehydrogenase (short-subunit alcohol dehydrogenase family)